MRILAEQPQQIWEGLGAGILQRGLDGLGVYEVNEDGCLHLQMLGLGVSGEQPRFFDSQPEASEWHADFLQWRAESERSSKVESAP